MMIFICSFSLIFLTTKTRLSREIPRLLLTFLLQSWNFLRVESFRRSMRSGSVRWVVLERGGRTLNLTNSTWSAFGVSIYCVVSSLLVPFLCFCSKWFASLYGTNDSRRSLLLHRLSRQILTVLRSFTTFLTSLMRRKKLSRKSLLNLTILQVPLANHMYICSDFKGYTYFN